MNTTDRLNALITMLDADPKDAFCLYGIAQEYASRSEHDQAIEYYDRAIGSDPSDAYAYFHKARSLESLGLFDKAKDTLRSGTEVAQENNDTHAVGELQGYLQELSEQS
jgi:tetratricopeptide (TPR) repeat protein